MRIDEKMISIVKSDMIVATRKLYFVKTGGKTRQLETYFSDSADHSFTFMIVFRSWIIIIIMIMVMMKVIFVTKRFHFEKREVTRVTRVQ